MKIDITEASAALRSTGATPDIIETIVHILKSGRANLEREGVTVRLRLDDGPLLEITDAGLRRIE